jgi:hypothetical protein
MPGNDILHASSISPQVLVSQQLGTADVALYTVPSGQSAKIAQGSLCNVTSRTTAPTLTLGSTSSTGGTLAAGTYYWKVTAKSATGETLGSNEVTATTTGSTSSQPLSWTAVPGAVSFNVYRGTSAGGENVIVTNTTATSYTDTGTAGGSASVPASSTFSAPASVYLSIVKAGGTVGDGTHRVIHNYSLAGNDTLALQEYLGGAMLGPGDMIAAYSSLAGAVDLVVTGTVHA